MANSLKHIKKELGFSEGPGLIYGYYDDYMVSFSMLDKEIELFVDAALDENDQDTLNRLRTFLKSNAASYDLTGTSFSPTGISVRAGEKKYEPLLEFFFIFMNQLKLLRIAGKGVCANCGLPIGDNGVLLKIGHHAHTCDDACAQRILTSGKAKAAEKTKKRVFAGTLGAILVGLLGAILYFILGLLGYTCAPAAFLIPLAAALGFYAFGGRPCVGKAVVCFVVPLIVFALVCLVLLGYSVYTAWTAGGYVFTFSELFDSLIGVLRDSAEFREQFLNRQVLFGGIFLLAGFVFTLPTAFAKREPYFMILKEGKNG